MEGQMRLKGDVVHVQVGREDGDGYDKFDVPTSEVLEGYIQGELAKGNNLLSLAGEGNSDQYVPVDVEDQVIHRRALTFTVTVPVEEVE